MNEEMRTFGYLCPKCGKTVMGTRSVFALAASNAEVECECGESRLQVKFDGEKYQVYVPCGLCGETHMAVCPADRILHGATALGCAQTKQFACFIGDEGTVEKNLRELAILAEKEKQHQPQRQCPEQLMTGDETECHRRQKQRKAKCGHELQAFPGMTSFMWQQRSSRSRSVAAGMRSLAPHSRQTRSTALRRISIP